MAKPIFSTRKYFKHKSMHDVCFLVMSVLRSDNLKSELTVTWYNTKYNQYIPGIDTVNVSSKDYDDYIEYDISKAQHNG